MVRIDRYHVGLATDDLEVLDDLTRMYAPRIIDDPGAPMNFSVASYPGSVPARKPVLLNGRCPILRARDPRRVLHRLDLELAAFEREPGPGTIEVSGLAALVLDGQAHVFPTRLAEPGALIESVFPEAAGGLVSSGGLALVTTADGVGLVVRRGLSAADVARWGAAPGRYPIRSVHWTVDDAPIILSPGGQLVHVLRRISSFDHVAPGRVLEKLSQLPTGHLRDPLPAAARDALRVLRERLAR